VVKRKIPFGQPYFSCLIFCKGTKGNHEMVRTVGIRTEIPTPGAMNTKQECQLPKREKNGVPCNNL